MTDEPQIRVSENGPYRVRGGTRLVRTAVVESEYGEPIAWAPDEAIGVDRAYSLCRCGRSSNKPFCDDTHLRWAFDGKEVADRRPRSERMHVYDGDGMQMTDDPTLCTHVGFCTNRRTHVWEMIHQTDDPDVKAELLAMLSRCPSGRLGRRPSADLPEVEPTFEPSVAVVRDGPLWVRGGVEVVGADGVAYERRNRVTLCRCGASGNMPFCDGTHYDIDFRDDAAGSDVAASDDATPRPAP